MGSKRVYARNVLKQILRNGELMAVDVIARARQVGVRERYIRHAKRELGVLSEKTAEGWRWSLPGNAVYPVKPKGREASPTAAPERPPVEPMLLDAHDAAAMVGISRSTLLSLVRTGFAPKPVRLKRRALWRVSDMRAWVDGGCAKWKRIDI